MSNHPFPPFLRILFLSCAVPVLLSAQTPDKQRVIHSPRHADVTGAPQYAVMNINNITAWARYDGQSNHSPSGDDGTYFPRGTGSVVYQDGLVWGGIVYTDAAHTTPHATQRIRVGGGTYGVGTQAGAIVNPSLGMAGAELASNVNVHIYRIRRDYYQMTETELRSDASSIYEIPENSITMTHTSAVRNQYDVDWNTWPTTRGAPYIERNGVPGYQAPPPFSNSFGPDSLISGGYDEPGIAGSNAAVPADQVLWTVYHDLNPSVSVLFEGSAPLGLEIQKTVWAYKRSDFQGNVLFNRYRIINKGGVDVDTAPGDQFGAFWIDSMFVCQWSDPDVGNAGDDLLGCDTTLSLGYVYNGGAVDAEYRNFHLPPPSAGYDFLAGPIVSGSPADSAVFDLKRRWGRRNLGMSSFAYFSAGSNYSDPPTGPAAYVTGTGRWWKMLRGFAPLGDINSADEPYAFPPGMSASKFPLSGDPVAQTGWLDGKGQVWSSAPGDKRLLTTTGPFALAPGDTQEVVTAFLAGLGADRLSSIAVLKAVDQFAQGMYSSLFSLPDVPPLAFGVSYPSATEALVRITATDAEREYSSVGVTLLKRTGIAVAEVTLADDGAHDDGAANDGVFGSSVVIPRELEPLAATLHFVPVSGFSFSVPRYDAGVVTAGSVEVSAPVIVFENIGHDGVLSADESARFTFTVANRTPFTLSTVTVVTDDPSMYGSQVIPSMDPNGEFTQVYVPDADSSYTRLHIPSGWDKSTITLAFAIRDGAGNTWKDSVTFSILPAPPIAAWSASLGPEGGNVSVLIRDYSGALIAFPKVGVYRSTNAGTTWTKVAGNSVSYVHSGFTLPNGSMIAAASQGVYRSTDHGLTWAFLPRERTSSLTIDANGTLSSAYNGLFQRSYDGGIDWSTVSNMPFGSAVRQALVADDAGRLVTHGDGAVYVSTDSGKVWTPTLQALREGLVLKIASDNTLFFSTDSVFYRSTDHGTSWSPLALGITPGGVNRIAFGPAGEVYATRSDWDSLCFTSTDNGSSWTNSQAKFTRAHVLLRSGTDTLYGSARGVVVRSTDGGTTWAEAVAGMRAVSVPAFARAGSDLLAATSRGVYRSSDEGISWTPSMEGAAFGPDGLVFATGSVTYAWSGPSVYRSLDGGSSWTYSSTFFSAGRPQNILTGASGAFGVTVLGLAGPEWIGNDFESSAGAIYRTTDGGESWSVVRALVGPFGRVSDIASLGSSVFFALPSFSRPLLSTDNGVTWGEVGDSNIQFREIGLDASGRLHVGLTLNVLRSTDQGNSWNLLPATGLSGQVGASEARVSALAFGSAGAIFVGTLQSSNFEGTVGSGVYLSRDDGITFENITAGIGIGARASILDLAVTTDQALLAGTHGEGMYRTTILTEVGQTQNGIPTEFRLDPNFPNPFNPTTLIRFSLPGSANVQLKIYSLLGQEITSLVDEPLPAGRHERTWNGRDRLGRSVASGVYLARIIAGARVATIKMMLLK